MNELLGQDDLEHTFDHAGNMRVRQQSSLMGSSTVDVTYTHDAWNRLVRVAYDTSVRGEYAYNGLNWRVMKTADTNADRTPDERRLMFYSASWQLLEERVDDEAPFDAVPDPESADIDRHVQHVWGVRYIDDVICHRQDDDPHAPSPAYDETWYHLTDVQFSTVAVVDDSSRLVERVSYDPYGHARHHWKADVDGDGDHDTADRAIIYGIVYGPLSDGSIDISEPAYDVDADLDRNGAVDRWDYTNAKGGRAALALGMLSDPNGPDGSIGLDGYVFNGETGAYCVRHRWYETGLGRWLERDPSGSLDGANLYQFVSSQPTLMLDPSGLCQSAKGTPANCPLPVVSPAPTPVIWPGGYTPHPDPRNVAPSGPETKCCARFKHPSANAQVMCCGGKRIICVWKPVGLRHPVPGPRAKDQPWRKGYDRGRALADKCLIRHERRHVTQPQFGCKGKPDGPGPDPATGSPDDLRDKCEHCKILRAHLGCINRANKSCKTGGCRWVLAEEREVVQRVRNRVCRQARGKTDPIDDPK
ncbi:MAG: hypothetical protein GY716_13725 [bacterium]|nr:hypothetical protein [bacterium]